MTNYRRSGHENDPVALSFTEAAWLLNDLCAQVGFCLPPKKRERLESNPPGDVDSFARAVCIAEGLNPDLLERQIYRRVRDIVATAFERAASSKRATMDE